jgi:hypothetical protein
MDHHGFSNHFPMLKKYNLSLECGHKISYFVPRYFKTSWLMAKLTCESYGMKFASFETECEYDAVRKMLIDLPTPLTDEYAFVNGMTLTPRSPTDWYWMSTGEKAQYSLDWGTKELNFGNNDEWCLCIGPKSGKNPKLADVDCTGETKRAFICEKNEM